MMSCRYTQMDPNGKSDFRDWCTLTHAMSPWSFCHLELQVLKRKENAFIVLGQNERLVSKVYQLSLFDL